MASARVKVGASAASLVLSLAAGLVMHFEGYVPKTYADPVGIPTICYGHTGSDVRPGEKLDRLQCEQLLRGDLAAANHIVHECVHRDMPPRVEAALTSFAFNVGRGGIEDKDGFCILKNGRIPKIRQFAMAGNWNATCAALSEWVYAGGEILPGLVRRRAAERALCEGRQS